MIRLENGEFLYALILLAVFSFIYYWMRRWRSKNIEKFGQNELISRLLPDVSVYKPHIKFALLMIALAFIIFGIINPQIGTKLEEVKREGVDVIIAIDVSNSMRAEDIKPSRLDRAKQSVSKLIDSLQDDRIGLIVFAGEAYPQLPMTTDFSAAKLFLSTVSTDNIQTQGTAIGHAIFLATKMFDQKVKKHKALIIITDGENHEDDAIGAATEAANEGIIIHTIGFGSDDGSPIPIYSGGGVNDFMKDKDGNTVITKLDPTMLQQIASAGGGEFIHSYGSDPELAKLINNIAGMEKKKYGSKEYTEYESRFQYFIGAAFLFLIIDIFLSERKNKFIKSLKLFEEKK